MDSNAVYLMASECIAQASKLVDEVSKMRNLMHYVDMWACMSAETPLKFDKSGGIQNS